MWMAACILCERNETASARVRFCVRCSGADERREGVWEKRSKGVQAEVMRAGLGLPRRANSTRDFCTV